MADAETKKKKPKERDFRNLFRMGVLVSLVFLTFFLLKVIFSGTVGSFWDDEAKSNHFSHIVTSTKPFELTDWSDVDINGKVDPGEREVVQVEAGCYTFSAVGTTTLLSHDPKGAYKDLGGGNLLINGRHFRKVVQVTKKGPVKVSFSPFPTTTDYPKVIDEAGNLSYEKVSIKLTPTACP